MRKRLSDVLVAQRLMPPDQLEQLAREAAKAGQNLGRLLIERGVLTEERFEEILSKELGIPVISLAKYHIDPAVARLVPERVARQYTIIALTKFANRLVVAMADPLDVLALDDLKVLTQVAIDPVLSSPSEILQAIDQVYTRAAQAEESANAAEGGATDDTAMETALALAADRDDEAPTVRVINLMIVEAMRRRASDIHLEPSESDIRIRYRVDGRLIEGHRLPKKVQSAVLSRIKIMSGLDITESRLPQDGRFRVRLETREVDFRVSVLPLTQGGKVVLRLLDRANLSVGLENLGFMPDSIRHFQQSVKRPFGMILVTGPTGSGKSTTLYSILNQLNDPRRNLITIEDPVEYQLEGVTQVQVNADVGMTFASGLRALLRQSPDVVMVGEIRDFETADIAMKASLTGQLVLSTLHTNDAPSAVTRLVDMGIEPFLVASSVSLIEAQRLVRRLCAKCRKPVTPPKPLLEELEFTPGPEATFYSPGSCRLCNNTGYKGRMGMIEVFEMDEGIRELVVNQATSWQIKDYAVRNGMVTLRRDGLQKAAMGMTTLEEVLMVTGEE